ncbi:MAG: RNA methyltransferase [Phycisphaerae bacterium]|nr:RNA methyltransferase [Phycisphaerae bacterium]
MSDTRKRKTLLRDDKPRTPHLPDRGYWGIGVYHPKKEHNFGTILRNAYAFGASFVFTVGPRFRLQAADTARAWRHVPVFRYQDMDDLRAHLPYACSLVGVEIVEEAIYLPRFSHPERACYLLGAEDYGLPREVVACCEHAVRIPGAAYCLNLATAAAIIMYDRVSKRTTRVLGPLTALTVPQLKPPIDRVETSGGSIDSGDRGGRPADGLPTRS